MKDLQKNLLTPKERYSICERCERLFAATKTCKECGCFMWLKVRFEESTCPLDKW